MRKKSPSPADGMGGADESADESLDGIWIEPITSTSSASDQPGHAAAEGFAIAPDWRKRLSKRGKASRTLVIALVVIAALVVLLPSSTFTLPPGIARNLTPAPTQTPQPGRFPTGEWEPVAGPSVQTTYFYDLIPSPTNPNTAYACLFNESTEHSSVAQLWVTRDAGYTWRQANLPTVTGSNCTVSPALDGSHRVSLSVDNSPLEQNAQPCDHNQYLLSEDDGASWRPVQHASILPVSTDGGTCQLWPTARRLFMWNYSYTAPGDAFLERSDDGGLSWRRVDAGLAGLNAFSYPELLDASSETLGAFVGAKPDLWISRDAGTTWQRMGPIARDVGGIQLAISDLVTEASFGHAPRTCRCAFAVSSSGFLGDSAGRQIFISRDYTHWSPLPPLPVEGTSATRSGVFRALGPTADGRLLALGAEPDTGLPTTLDRGGIVSGPPPRLWAWNTHTGRWELAGNPIPCEDLQTCNIYTSGASAVVRADGALLGTMVWLAVVKGQGTSQSVTQTTFRLFVPAN